MVDFFVWIVWFSLCSNDKEQNLKRPQRKIVKMIRKKIKSSLESKSVTRSKICGVKDLIHKLGFCIGLSENIIVTCTYVQTSSWAWYMLDSLLASFGMETATNTISKHDVRYSSSVSPLKMSLYWKTGEILGFSSKVHSFPSNKSVRMELDCAIWCLF